MQFFNISLLLIDQKLKLTSHLLLLLFMQRYLTSKLSVLSLNFLKFVQNEVDFVLLVLQLSLNSLRLVLILHLNLDFQLRTSVKFGVGIQIPFLRVRTDLEVASTIVE